MMSEKRFYLDENGINDKEYEFSLLGEDELVDIINRIVDENEQLRNEKEELQKYIKKVEDDYYDYYAMTLRNSEWFK